MYFVRLRFTSAQMGKKRWAVHYNIEMNCQVAPTHNGINVGGCWMLSLLMSMNAIQSKFIQFSVILIRINAISEGERANDKNIFLSVSFVYSFYVWWIRIVFFFSSLIALKLLSTFNSHFNLIDKRHSNETIFTTVRQIL